MAKEVYYNSREVPGTVPPANAGVVKPKQQSLSCVLGPSLLQGMLRPHSPPSLKKVPAGPFIVSDYSVSLSFNVILAGTLV